MALVAKRLDEYKDVIVWQNEDSQRKKEWLRQRKLATQSQSSIGHKSQSQSQSEDEFSLGDCENNNEPSCLLFQKIEWNEKITMAEGANRYQKVRVEEAFRKYNSSTNMPKKTIEKRWNAQFHTGEYKNICDDTRWNLGKYKPYE